jgi:ankyrin repeat protein
LLIENGADASIKNMTDEASPLDLAAQHNHRNFVEKMVAAAASNLAAAIGTTSNSSNNFLQSQAELTVDDPLQQKAPDLQRRLQLYAESGSDPEELIVVEMRWHHQHHC